MSTLSDICIREAVDRGELKIEPWDRILEEGRLQPASVDLLLGDTFLIPVPTVFPRVSSFVTGAKPKMNPITTDRFTIGPKQFILATTVETITIGGTIRGSIEGKSTIGRWGLCVHITAGYFDPGFSGQATLELVNHAPYPIELCAGQRICQMAFHFMNRTPSELYGSKKYGSHYQGQRGATGPRD